MTEKKQGWFAVALSLKGSVIPEILPRVLLCGVIGVLVYLVRNYTKIPLSFPILGSLILNLVLGLLLVFRTNTAYERFWEGRKAWGSLVNTVRNLSRLIWVAVAEMESGDRAKKVAVLRLLVAFAVSMKLHLRHQPINTELEALVSRSQFEKLKTMNHPPLEIAFWIGDYLQQQHERGAMHIHQLDMTNQLLNTAIDALGACERIQKTPIPPAYAIHLKQLLLLYCLSLPFQIVDEFGLLTGPTVALTSFALLGIEEIGIQIEDPFGYDSNDLPLNAICSTMLRNIEDLITLAPCRGLKPGDKGMHSNTFVEKLSGS